MGSKNKITRNLVTYNCIGIFVFPKPLNRTSRPRKSDKRLQSTSLNATRYLHLYTKVYGFE